MKTACLRCSSDFDCRPSAHPPRFCEPCVEVLESHASKHELSKIRQAKNETRHMANGRHIPK